MCGRRKEKQHLQRKSGRRMSKEAEGKENTWRWMRKPRKEEGVSEGV